MQKKDIASLARNTVLAYTANGDMDIRFASDAVVVLDTEGLWTHRWSRHSVRWGGSGGKTRIVRANPLTENKVSMGNAIYGRGVTGYLALHGSPEVLVELAETIDLDALPENVHDFALPHGVVFKVVHPRRVLGTWDEREEGAQAAREREERAEAHRQEGRRQRKAEVAYIDTMTELLGVEHAVHDDMISIRLLERIARAEGVALPERPEHLRDMK